MYTDETGVFMPFWGRVIVFLTVLVTLGGAYLLYEMARGNRAVMILLGCAVAIIGGALWKTFRGEDVEK